MAHGPIFEGTLGGSRVIRSPSNSAVAERPSGASVFAPVDVWTIDLEAPREPILAATELERANRFRFERDCLHWTHARSALRAILSRYLDRPPLAISFELGPHGKPSVAGIEFNLSHSGGWALIAVSPEAPVGIDLETIRPKVDMARLLERIGETELTGSSEQLFQVWARREARTKAIGGPLMVIPNEDLRVVDLVAPPGFAAALAMLANDPEVRYCGGV